jgi:alkylation response protein AidB-like acyl-CoA dehydrogenase
VDLALTPGQVELAAGIRSLVAERFDPALWEDTVARAPGYDPRLWADLMAGGWVTVGLPEVVGGAGRGVTELAVVAEELGRGPVPSPMLNGMVLSGRVLLAAAPDEGRLAELVAGRRRFATCLPPERWDRRDHRPPLRADRSGRRWTLDGVAPFVPHAAAVDELLVVAETSSESGEAALVAVDAGTSGISVQSVPTLGGDRPGHVSFDRVAVERDGLLGAPGSVEPWLGHVADVTRTAVAAEMVGAASAALDHATAWAAARVQFGTPIGSFQAVQHRLADALIDVLTARDAVFDVAGAIDRGEGAEAAAAGVKAYCADACRRVTAAAHQVCGGEGIYADQPLHLWHRRVAGLVPVLGTVRSHRQAVASALFGS